MGARTIETKAVISAQDKTGATFAAVAQKLRNIENTASAASRRMDGITSRMSAVGRQAAFHQDIARRMARADRVIAGPGFGSRMSVSASAGFKSAMAPAAGAGAGAALAPPVLHRIVDAATRRASERMSQSLAGLTEEEQRKIRQGGRDITLGHPSLSQTVAEGLIRDARTYVGSVEDAIKIREPLAQLSVILSKAGGSAEDLNAQLGEIVRSADQIGATASAKKFAEFADDFAKMQNAFPGVVSGSQYREFIQGTRGAASGWSQQFRTGVLPSLLQTVGSEGGVALQSLHTAIVGGQMDKKAKAELARIGLLDKAGRVVGRQVAQKDPFEWAQRFLRPAMEKRGIKTKEAQSELIDRLFSDRTARQAGKMLTLADSAKAIERDRAAVAKAMGLAGAAAVELRDLTTATNALKSQFDNLGAVLGGRINPGLTDLSNIVAKRVGSFAAGIVDDRKAQERILIGGGLGLTALGGLGLSGVSGLFSGAGFVGGMGAGIASLPATTPVFAAGAIGAGAYKGYEAFKSVKDVDKLPPQNWLEEKAAAFDRWAGIAPKQKSWAEVAAGLRQMGANGQIKAEAELKGKADVTVKVEVKTDKDSVVKEVTQQIQASGNMRSDVGTTMPMGE
ncbi:MAG: hypothetical protein AB7U61_07125 [Methylocystis sp.]